MKQFATAARRGTAATARTDDIEFEFEIAEGEFRVLTAHAPTSGQIAVFLTNQRDGGTQTLRAMLDFMRAILDPDSYAVIERKLQTGLDIDVLSEIVTWLIEEWSGRPTQPSSASSSSPNGTGPPSTETLPAAVSTTST